MWISYIAAAYLIHFIYNYMAPWYWNKNATIKNSEEARIRMRDALASSIL